LKPSATFAAIEIAARSQIAKPALDESRQPAAPARANEHNNPQGSIYNELGLNLDLNVGDERTELSGHVLTGLVGYWDRPGKKIDPNIDWNLTLNHQVNERTRTGSNI